MTVVQFVTLVLLGFIVGSLVVFALQLRALRSRSPYSPLWEAYHHPGAPPGFQLFEMITAAERDAGVQLTWGARQMFIIPIVGALELRADVDWRDVESSIRDIVRTVAEEPAPEERDRATRSSLSVIRAFFRRFCNIPPFCSRRDEARE
jgi:hypothetical protein